jgi:hypothetical protein
VRGRETDFVDPQLGWLVGMDIVDPGGKAHHQTVVDGDSDVMAGIGEEFCDSIGIDSVVEDFRGDIHENGFVAALQYFDFDRHKVVSRLTDYSGLTGIEGVGFGASAFGGDFRG